MSKLRVASSQPDEEGCVLRVTPESAGWRYVGFEVYRLASGTRLTRTYKERETCVVLLSGRGDVAAGDSEWRDVGDRATVFDGPPTALYVPPGREWSVTAAERSSSPSAPHRPSAAPTFACSHRRTCGTSRAAAAVRRARSTTS